MKILAAIGLICIATASACASKVDVDKIAPGTDVQVTRQDGGLVAGSLKRVDPERVVIRIGNGEQSVRRVDIADVHVMTAADRDAVPVGRAKFRAVDVPNGTPISVQMDTAVASDTNRSEDPVEARLTEPVTIDGITALPAGTIVRGVVAEARPSGKVQGRAVLALRFRSIDAVDHGERYSIDAGWSHEAAATKGNDAKKIGIPAAGGAIIGALFGGGKGAAIGAGVGGGIGAVDVLTTAGHEVRIGRGTLITVRLDRGFEARVPFGR